MDREIKVVSDPSVEDMAFLEERIYEFNVEATGIGGGEWLAIFVRDERSAIVAGLTGTTWGGCCRIRDFWIDGPLRRQGLGSRMLRAAEQEARRRGCSLIHLASHSFQAPDFYRKHGYEVFAVLEDNPAGHSDVYLRKRLLPPSPRDQARATARALQGAGAPRSRDGAGASRRGET